jgi:hypothetical protein
MAIVPPLTPGISMDAPITKPFMIRLSHTCIVIFGFFVSKQSPDKVSVESDIDMQYNKQYSIDSYDGKHQLLIAYGRYGSQNANQKKY